jgi:hypothetical protein
MIYDCHQKRRDEVRDELLNWIYLNQHRTPLEIITGNSEGMKGVVKEVCKESGILIRESWVNGGVLIIDRV